MQKLCFTEKYSMIKLNKWRKITKTLNVYHSKLKLLDVVSPTLSTFVVLI